jgi:predicted nicotinamide N-methyase
LLDTEIFQFFYPIVIYGLYLIAIKLFDIFYSFIVHRNETNVSQCGYQLWNGALLLCEYILTNQSQFLNKTILEVGAGIGLCSLIASRFASKVICTGKLTVFPLTNFKINYFLIDHDCDLLEVIKTNIEINDDVCKKQCIHIQKFDWKQFNVNQIDNDIEIILAADGIFYFLEMLF